MAGEWLVAPLEELVDDIVDRRGVTPLKLGSDFVAHGYRVISAKAIKGRRVDLSADEPRFVNEATYRKWMKTPLLHDDVILTSEAPLGEPAYVSDDVEWCLGQRLFGIRTKKARLYGRFLFYAFQSEHVRHDLLSRATGTTAQGIRQTELRLVRIPLPRVEEQRAIAYILGTLDDKIELNRRMNETLEAMARALFKSWFVDFDPVRAKAEGRDPGLPNPLAELFPARLVDSELGEIPEGWVVKKIGDLLELAYGKALKAEDRRDGNVPVYGSNGQVGWHEERLAVGPGIVVGRKGNPGIATWVPTDFFPIDTTFYVLPKPSCRSLQFLFHALQTHDLASLGADSAVPGLNRNLAYMSAQLLPTESLLVQFERLASALSRRVNVENDQSRTLAALRDTLLPKLISGDMRVKNAERFVGAVT
ncbi:MAG: restriction endonuclease subunit S [Betaproteobacteria bacterium]|nr:MAG: restriction endonuclease subunit S [Betaproteobacteria bacterium]